jgi:hypothetical protein
MEKKHNMIQSTYKGTNDSKYGVVKKYRRKTVWGGEGWGKEYKRDKNKRIKSGKNMEDKLISNR